ncbi:MAG: NAD-dependent epimerase/dehydratase family protein [Alphaproteobacteria bacterium]|nr:NAD-dependent epimerase/dehydratase family protein [Alphaproteobacteria bacterium]
MTRRVLVTGGSGFVGRHLVDAFADAGHEVTAFDLRSEPWRDDVRFVEGDLCDALLVASLCEGKDTVVHNASLVHTRRNMETRVWDVNLGGSRNVLAGCRAHGVRRLVYLSSASAVYEGRDIEGGDETMPYSSISQAPYADSKIAAEKEILAASDEALATVAIRPHVVFGPHDQRFLPAILERARQGRMRFAVGLGTWLSDFTYVDNLVDAVLAAEARLEPGGPVAGQAYFVTNGEPTAFFDFVGQVLAELDLPPIVYRIPYPVVYAVAAITEGLDTLRGGSLGGEHQLSRFAVRYLCTHHWFAIDKARRDLDWAPKVTIAEGIRRTAAWLRETGWT